MVRVILFTLVFNICLFSADFGALLTGSKNGTYIKMGEDIKNIVAKYNIDLNITETKGSLDNLDFLSGVIKQKKTFWGIVQKDAYCYHKHKAKRDKEIKMVLPLYNEEIHVFIKEGEKIDFNKRKDFTVGVFSRDSGSYVTARYLETSYHLNFKYVFMDINSAVDFLKDDSMDMYISVIGKPSTKFFGLKGLELLELPKNVLIDTLYKKTKVTKNDYKWVKEDKFVYSVPSVLVTNIINPKYNFAIEKMIKIIVKNRNELISNGHQKWRNFDYKGINNYIYYHNASKKLLENLQ